MNVPTHIGLFHATEHPLLHPFPVPLRLSRAPRCGDGCARPRHLRLSLLGRDMSLEGERLEVSPAKSQKFGNWNWSFLFPGHLVWSSRTPRLLYARCSP